jgi:hypothetical protein
MANTLKADELSIACMNGQREVQGPVGGVSHFFGVLMVNTESVPTI